MIIDSSSNVQEINIDQHKYQHSLTQKIIINDWTTSFSKFNIAAGSLFIIRGGPV